MNLRVLIQSKKIICQVLVFVFLFSNINAQNISFDFDSIAFKNNPINLRISIPKNNIGQRPMVIFLHGAGERGVDNISQLKHLQQLLINCNNSTYLDSAIFLAPQCPDSTKWVNVNWKDTIYHFPSNLNIISTYLMNAIDSVQNKYLVDPNRIYLIGLSMGGFGVNQLLEENKDKFAAAISICGGVDLSMKNIPLENIWFFNGTNDKVVNPKSILTFSKSYQNNSNLKLTLLRGVGHNAWDYAFTNCQLLPWLFSKKIK